MRTVLSAAAAICGAFVWLWRRPPPTAEADLVEQLRAALARAQKERQAERSGRIRAQKELRDHLVRANGGSSSGPPGAFPLAPIGVLRSCFSTRNGTPRQPLLVPAARARLDLAPGGVPAAALEGLSAYSHVWLIYIFHQNTDLPRLWKPAAHQGLRAKVQVPRLDGGKMGVLATRSPHRPVPIGLSVAKVDRVDGGSLYVSGADLVDGTPVLDVKPYLPYCDALGAATTPAWAQGEREDDPLRLASVRFAPDFDNQLARCWKLIQKESLYESADDLRELASQVLARDIRSVHQRHPAPDGPQRIRSGERAEAALPEGPRAVLPHAGAVSEAPLPLHCVRAAGDCGMSQDPIPSEGSGHGCRVEVRDSDVSRKPAPSAQEHLDAMRYEGPMDGLESGKGWDCAGRELWGPVGTCGQDPGKGGQRGVGRMGVLYRLVVEGLTFSYTVSVSGEVDVLSVSSGDAGEPGVS